MTRTKVKPPTAITEELPVPMKRAKVKPPIVINEELPEGLYHEKQQGSLCAMHCLNNLLQGPVFSEWQLREFAKCLDFEESRLSCSGMGDDGNASDAGFNVQVIISALRSIGCAIELQQVKHSREVLEQLELLQALICNQNKHWFAVRQIGDDWFDLNSVLDSPIRIKKPELTEYLNDALAGEQSVFLVRGELQDGDAAMSVRA
eukprot:TRINITY_DN26278_c0_g1_i2.p1 TRINITY_DN26278_c0_g1~~TRINITY_DN26278_c0_g1_i2.p1  ORF type:complete len:204 (+),score=46.05 TRINITY_DN26278_c0_g1_i2:107-718(+)